jgi:hypothetical protein
VPVTMEQVVNALLPDEVDYQAAATLGPEALPLLEQLVAGDNPELATKAASLAGHIAHPQAAGVLQVAANSDLPTVRVAAAAATRHLPADMVTPVLQRLLSDGDAGVRKVALSAVPEAADEELRASVRQAAQADPNKHLRTLAGQVEQRLSGTSDATGLRIGTTGPALPYTAAFTPGQGEYPQMPGEGDLGPSSYPTPGADVESSEEAAEEGLYPMVDADPESGRGYVPPGAPGY